MKRTGLFLSAAILVQMAMPVSPNGRIIGIALTLLALFIAAKIPEQGLPSKYDLTPRILLLSAMIAAYYFLTRFYMLQGYDIQIPLFQKLHLNPLVTICLAGSFFSLYAIITFLHCCKPDTRLELQNIGENTFYRFSVIYGILCLLFMSALCFNRETWFDETFSMAMIKHPFSEIVSLTGRDVHPPLYYFILKVFVDMGHKIIPSAPLVAWGKICSVAPYTIAYIIVIFYGKKEFGKRVSGLSVICLFGMANMMEYGLEIRMYGWAMLFIAIAYLYMHRILKHGGMICGDWIGFSVFSLFSAYTHYYAVLAAAVLFLYLLIQSIRCMKCLKKWLWTAVFTIAAYVPWLRILFVSFASVTSRSWPAPVTLETVTAYFRFIFGYYSTFPLVLTAAVFYFLQEKKSGKHDTFLWTGFLCPFLIMAIGVIVSILYAPVLTDRYLFVAMGCMWIAVAYMTMNSRNRNLQAILIRSISVFSLINLFIFTKNQIIEIRQVNEFYAAITTFADQGMLATNAPDIAYDIAVTCEEPIYLFEEGNGALMRDVFAPQITEVNLDLSGFLDEYETEICLLINKDNASEIESVLSLSTRSYTLNDSLPDPYKITAYFVNN